MIIKGNEIKRGMIIKDCGLILEVNLKNEQWDGLPTVTFHDFISPSQIYTGELYDNTDYEILHMPGSEGYWDFLDRAKEEIRDVINSYKDISSDLNHLYRKKSDV